MAVAIGDGKNPNAIIHLEASEKENAVVKTEEAKKTEEKVQKSTLDKISTPVIQDTDSSYYSVNKFNILFYFIYKVNFLEKNEEPVLQELTK